MNDQDSVRAEQLHAFLRSRRSVRKFSDKAIPEKILKRILESAIWAPNAHNRQAWHFVRLKTKSSRAAILGALSPHFASALVDEGLDSQQASEQATHSNQKIELAPEAILLCLDLRRIEHYQNEKRDQGERKIAEQSLALAGGQMLLAAHAEGLAGVWVCAPLFVPGEIQKALDLADNIFPQAVILTGYPIGRPRPKERRNLSDVFSER